MHPDTIYVPIIKGKSNDLYGVGVANSAVRNRIKPLIEALPTWERDIDKHVFSVCHNVRKNTPLGPKFVDFYGLLPTERTSDGEVAIVAGYRLLQGMQVPVTPVFGLERDDSLWTRIGEFGHRFQTGFCFRISRSDLTEYEAEDVWQEIIGRSKDMGFAPEQIDIVLDCREVYAQDVTGMHDIVSNFLVVNSQASRYRSIVVAGSSALRQVGDIAVDGSASIRRNELRLWARLHSDHVGRLNLTFGDYAVIHPDFSDQQPSKYMNAKIRYTAGDRIIYHRGHGLLHPIKDFDQYHSLARRAQSERRYQGPDASFGDQYIRNVAEGLVSPGSPAKWIRADVNRHVTYTTGQIERLLVSLADVDLSEVDDLAAAV